MKSSVQVSGVMCSALKGCIQLLEVQEHGQGWPLALFISPQANRAVTPLEQHSARSLDTVVPGTGHGGAPLNGHFPMAKKLAIGAPNRVAVAPLLGWR